jgi:antitoxin HicB
VTDLQYPIAIQKVDEEDGGGYLAWAVDLKGCLGDGNTPEEAVANLKGAIIEWLDEARRLERPIPVPGEVFARARKERQEIDGVIRKQDEFIKAQEEAFARLRAEITQLREQLHADRAGHDEAAPIWGSIDLGQITTRKAHHGKDDIRH